MTHFSLLQQQITIYRCYIRCYISHLSALPVTLYIYIIFIYYNNFFNRVTGGTPVVAETSKPAITITAPSSVVEKPSSLITTTVTPKTPTTTALNNPQPVVKLVKLSTPTTVITSCDITNNQEQIVEKAKQVIVVSLVIGSEYHFFCGIKSIYKRLIGISLDM